PQRTATVEPADYDVPPRLREIEARRHGRASHRIPEASVQSRDAVRSAPIRQGGDVARLELPRTPGPRLQNDLAYPARNGAWRPACRLRERREPHARRSG